MLSFVNYHRHSEYSNLYTTDSPVHLKDYCKRAKELGHTVLSTVEHGWVGNVFEAKELAAECGLKLVVGAEFYFVKDRTTDDKTNAHIIVMAMNENGREAINDIQSEANLSGFYYKPRIDLSLLMSLPEDDVIVTTACIGGVWKYDDYEDIISSLYKKFGKHLYLEVQPHNNERQAQLNKTILALHEKYGIELIAGTDSHYIYPEQSQLRDDLIETKGMKYEDEEDWYMDYPDGDELYRRFANQTVLSHEEILQAIGNTLIFEDVAEYDCPVFNDEIKLPTHPLYRDLSQEQRDEIYKKLVMQGWDEYKKSVPEERWPEYISEINKEMQVVIDTKMADYFIIDHYVMKKGKQNGGRLTKSGRGSGASFFTNTLLGFSDIDRISAQVHMYPERFMSTTRILQSKGIPDIDMNEAPTAPFVQAQAEVMGQDHSYPMVAYGTMKKSAAWKLYAKSQGVPFEIANSVSEQIRRYETAVKHADEEEKELIDVNDFIAREYKDIYAKSADYLGLITSWSIAPCSSLIYQGSIRREIGLVKVKDNMCVGMDGHVAEVGHFLKNDHLKVSVVDLIYRGYNRIGMDPPSVKELLEMCSPDDAAWSVYERGCTLGINQCEKEGTKARAMKYKPHNISELSAFVAAIRPGGASFYKKFESREPFSYGVKAFDDIIQTKEFPYSFLLYQEQVMKALNYAGIDMADCYTAIKNIAKKRAEKVLAYKDKFINGFREAIIRDENKTDTEAQELAESLWQVVEDSAGYSFNASHSYCVAIDSLYGAWLKSHHPLEFYETYINIMEEKGDKDKINEAREEASSYFGITFEPLRFGQDNRAIHAEDGKLINTIGSIKGYGVKIGRTLYECSKQGLTSFIDVLAYLDSNGIKEAKYKPLILIDYFSEFGNQRELSRVSEIWEFFKQGTAKQIKKTLIEDQTLASIVQKYTTGTTKSGSDAASYTFTSPEDVMRCMKECETVIKSLGLREVDMKIRIQNSIDILGYCDIRTGKEEDRRRLMITDVMPIKSQATGEIWSYRISTKSVGSGKTARLTVRIGDYNQQPINAGDLVYAHDVFLNNKGYWYLSSYTVER